MFSFAHLRPASLACSISWTVVASFTLLTYSLFSLPSPAFWSSANAFALASAIFCSSVLGSASFVSPVGAGAGAGSAA